MKPVNTSTVDNGWELAWTHSESRTNRRETQNNLDNQNTLSHWYKCSWYYWYKLTLSCLRTLSIKNDQQFSLVSCMPAPFTSLRIPLMTFSSSSSANNSGISPEASKSLITTRNLSSGTWASVRRNTVPTPFRPALMYSWAKSAYMSDPGKWQLQQIYFWVKVLLYLEVSNGVSFPQLNLEHLQSTDIGSQTSQALFTTATHSNK